MNVFGHNIAPLRSKINWCYQFNQK